MGLCKCFRDRKRVKNNMPLGRFQNRYLPRGREGSKILLEISCVKPQHLAFEGDIERFEHQPSAKRPTAKRPVPDVELICHAGIQSSDKNSIYSLKTYVFRILWQVVDADNLPFTRVFAQMGDAEIVDFMGKASVGAGIKGALDLG